MIRLFSDLFEAETSAILSAPQSPKLWTHPRVTTRRDRGLPATPPGEQPRRAAAWRRAAARWRQRPAAAERPAAGCLLLAGGESPDALTHGRTHGRANSAGAGQRLQSREHQNTWHCCTLVRAAHLAQPDRKIPGDTLWYMQGDRTA